MRPPLTNVHMHVFNAECAPDNFLKIIRSDLVRRFPSQIKWLLGARYMRQGIQGTNRMLNRLRRTKRKGIEKYISFLNVGTQREQMDIFEMAFKVARLYDPLARIVGLTLNMDYMDNQGGIQKNFATQLHEVKQIKRYYPANFFPFLSVDPRARSGEDLVNWVKRHFERGCRDENTGKVYPWFGGIKLYPALGFFPFDPRLEALYAYAEKEGIPIMTHCTRGGSQYVGSAIESLIPDKPAMILPAGSEGVQNDIYDRIARYKKEKWVQNSERGNNDLACDLFGHPQNYVPVMRTYPKLRICLAHLGGGEEMLPAEKKNSNETTELERIWEVDGHKWSELVSELMTQHECMYTDISYTLYQLHLPPVFNTVNALLKNPETTQRVLFGTDFYMTERDEREATLYQLAQTHLQSDFENIARDNCYSYLGF